MKKPLTTFFAAFQRIVVTLSLVLATVLGAAGVAAHNAPAANAAPQGSLPQLPPLPPLPQLPPLPAGSSDLQRMLQPPAPAKQGPQRVNTAKPAPRIGNGQQINVYTRSGGYNRRYILEMPTHYNPARPAPVIFGFDGWRDTPENFRRYSRLYETGARQQAIKVFPESINHGWEGAPYAVVKGGTDLRFFLQIIDEVDRTYNIDRGRIYATGHSNGGGMTAVVACHLPHVFAGAAAVGGAFYDPVNRGCKNRAIPFLIMHGRGDTMMKIGGGYRHNGAHYMAVRDLVNSYARRNGCGFPPRVTRIPGGERHVYPCARKELQLILNPQSHTWNRVPDASQEVWNFLSRQRL
ncbi:alpha/beta hydrolase family esterase [Corynebacterium macclintockiae]|uniref:alpha/beta hydrolase family esterase n=1 Tax=Corynebacterium macclintockiae TaxID=2913501 RepID=UPI003EB95D0F